MKNARRIMSLLFVIVMVLVLPMTALADDGDGSGGGSDELLALDASSISSGSKDVPLDVIITLTFSKNVVNFSVRDSNMECFSLKEEEGTTVKFSVLMGDDQVDPSIKRIIQIDPDILSPGTTYKLTISKNLTSKSGVNMASDVVITFTTIEAETPAPSPTATPTTSTATPKPSATPETSPSAAPETIASVTDPPETNVSDTPVVDDIQTVEPTETADVTDSLDTADDANENSQENIGSTAVIISMIAFVIVGGIGGYAYFRRKHKS